MKRMIIIAFAALLLLTACQRTPDAPIVIGKENDGWTDYEAEPSAAPVKYAAPERYENTLTYNDLTIEIDAEVVLPELESYPVYVLEPLNFTQDMADRIIPALLDGAELYDERNGRTKEFIRERIDYYTHELEAAGSDPESAELVPVYQQYLADLFVELETAPDDPARTPASRELKFKEGDNSLEWSYGKRVDNADGSFYFEWTEEGRRRAAAAGNAMIDGVCVQECGRKMYLCLKNSEHGNRIYFARDMEDNKGWQLTNADYDEAEAIRRADALIESMGLDCQLTECELHTIADEVESYSFYALTYCTTIPDTARSSIASALSGSRSVSDYAPALMQESIVLQFDGNGLYCFNWGDPVRIKRMDMQSAKLLPWETVEETMLAMLKVKNMWQNEWDAEDEYIVGRRLHIDRIALSYMQVRKDASLSECWYIPVWDVCGRLFYQYSEDYDPYSIVGGGYIVDENHERDVNYANGVSASLSFLTLNAIDGSAIDRNMGY